MAQENEFDHKTPEHMSQDQNDIYIFALNFPTPALQIASVLF